MSSRSKPNCVQMAYWCICCWLIHNQHLASDFFFLCDLMLINVNSSASLCLPRDYHSNISVYISRDHLGHQGLWDCWVKLVKRWEFLANSLLRTLRACLFHMDRVTCVHLHTRVHTHTMGIVKAKWLNMWHLLFTWHQWINNALWLQ